MFFVTYLRRELRRRIRQAVFIALGLALGVGLVVTVAAASAGVKKAQSAVLSALYGVGTDVTVTGGTPRATGRQGQNAQQFGNGPHGPELCNGNGQSCRSVGGQTIDNVNPQYAGLSAAKVAEAAGLHGVAAAAGGLMLQDTSITFPKNFSFSGPGGSAPPQPSSFTVDGVDTGHTALGPLSGASLTSGHSFTKAESDSDVAVVDSGYARAHGLKVGSAVSITQGTYTVIGIVSQPQASSPPDIYIPLARAQAISTQIFGRMTNEVNTIYVTAASAADISAVSKEISGLVPGATVTTATSLASQVTGSVSSAASLANDLGRWLSVLVLIAAFAVACLLTLAAVARRVREFGTLKAIGWRSRRITAQVLGECATMGIAGAVAGVGLGFAGAAIIAAIAPKLSATVGGNSGAQASAAGGGQQAQTIGGGHEQTIGGNLTHVVSVPLHPSVSVGVIVLAVVLAVAGGLLAGAFGSWRIAGLRPAAALARVA
jgi:putative ABC transport system permease protein